MKGSARADKEIAVKIAEIQDMETVEKTMAQLKSYGKTVCAVIAVEMTYFLIPDKDICKSDIQNRVQAAAIEIPAGERTIYRWLRVKNLEVGNN